MRTLVLTWVAGGCVAEVGPRPEAGLRSAARLVGAPRLTLSGDPNSGFGSVSAAGDFDGDGFGDVVVGSPQTPLAGGFDFGALEVHHGALGGLDPVARQTLRGDRVADTLGSVLAVGDFDGDGFDDLAATDDGDWGDPDPDRVVDRIPVWLGGPDGLALEPDLVLEDDALSCYGWALASGGDLDADGFDDLLVGDRTGPTGSGIRGRVVVYRGGPAGPDPATALVLDGAAPYDELGRSLAILGDVDGDGFDDAAILAPGSDDGGPDGGKVQIHHGGPGGLEPTPRAVILGASELDYVTDVTAAGDLDGDGHADLLLGKPYAAPGYLGRVDLHLGGPAGIDPAPVVTVTGADLGGTEVTVTHGIGDFDEDGRDDVVFKFDPVPQDAACALILGAPGVGIDLAAGGERFDVPNVGPASNFCWGVWSADVDGDGHLDLLVTDPYSDAAGPAAGAAFLFAGNEDIDLDGSGSLTDCDEGDPAIHPGAVELCDGVDQDCDEVIDDDAVPLPFEADRDGDGFTDRADAIEACPAPEGYRAPSDPADCDDSDPARHPEADEVAGDGIDQDCDGGDAPGADPDLPDDPLDDTGAEGKGGGCGCATGATGGLAPLAALGLLLVRRRR